MSGLAWEPCQGPNLHRNRRVLVEGGCALYSLVCDPVATCLIHFLLIDVAKFLLADVCLLRLPNNHGVMSARGLGPQACYVGHVCMAG